YYEWCKKNNFVSKLPADRKSQKDTAEAGNSQSTLDAMVTPLEKRTPYSQHRMNKAIWTFIIDTNQALSVIERSRFRNMIDVASPAKEAITLPDRKVTHAGIMQMFFKRMGQLKSIFTVSIGVYNN
ncbi:hypothetical protein BDP27DRAFT_1246184, partial [Rhodocollybia butyracea]